MAEQPLSPPTFEDLLNRFGGLLRQYEDGVEAFTRAVDEHVKVVERDPLLEALEKLLGEHEQRLQAFGAALEPGLGRLDQELEATMGKCREMLANVEGKKRELAQAITTVADRLQTDTTITLVDRAGVVDDLGDAAHSLARLVTEWFSTTRACQDLLYTHLERYEALLGSDEKLVASFTILLKMREELIHIRLEKREAFLKSAEDLLKSLEELLAGYQQMKKA